MRFIPNNGTVRQQMLADMGVSAVERLFDSIPEAVRLAGPLNLPNGMAESDQLDWFARLAAANRAADMDSYLGAGAYSHFSPLVADHLLHRGEWFTAYTPYQPEISQGTLQAIFEFQTFMCLLTGMDVANASVYDGASATAEAVLMADRLQKGRNRVLLAASLHPLYREVLETYTRNLGLKLETIAADPATGRLDLKALDAALGADVASVAVQQPNFFGVIEDLDAISAHARPRGALLVTSVTEALSLALLKPPGESGADIVCGEAQSFGVALAYGGPYLGFMACRDAHKRQLPGRIAGQTLDADGRPGYVLTLTTREQHIRREKATSNICTNQNLVMLNALMHLTLLGREGLNEAARQNVSLLSYFLSEIAQVPGFSVRFTAPRFNEVALRCPVPAVKLIRDCLARRILPGLDLGRFDPALADTLLVAITETKRKMQVDALVTALRELTAPPDAELDDDELEDGELDLDAEGDAGGETGGDLDSEPFAPGESAP
jgi:glycine dehydrogenase subunit 1